MNEKTKPVATLSALLAAITETIAAAEQRVMDRLDDIENRVIGLEDKIRDGREQADEVNQDLVDRLRRICDEVETIDTDAIDDVVGALDELADAERRRERAGWLADVRRAS